MTSSTGYGYESGERRNAQNRLDTAIDHQQRLEERHEAARGTSAEFGASVDLREAEQQVAARRAWSRWVERDDL